MRFLENAWSTNAWYTTLDELAAVFSGYYSAKGRCGDVWAINTPLDIFQDTEKFTSVYVDTLFGRLDKKIGVVKLVLTSNAYTTFTDDCRTADSAIRKNFDSLEARRPGALHRVLVRDVAEVEDEKVRGLDPETPLGFCAVKGRLQVSDAPLFFYRLSDVFHQDAQNDVDARNTIIVASYLVQDAAFESLRNPIMTTFADDNGFKSVANITDKNGAPLVSSRYPEDVRVMIVVALREEYAPIVNDVFPELQLVTGRRAYYEGTLRSNNSKFLYHLFAVTCVDMGSVDAAIVTTAGCAEFNPDHVVLLGIAGGRRNKVTELGDVVVGRNHAAYEYQKLHDRRIPMIGAAWGIRTEDEYRVSPAGTQLKDMVDIVKESWKCEIVHEDDGKHTVFHPKVHIGKVLCGSKIIESCRFMAREGGKDRSVVAVEMEMEGVARAASLAGCGSIVIKGVCDWADRTKGGLDDKRARSVGARAAAKFLREGLVQGALHVHVSR